MTKKMKVKMDELAGKFKGDKEAFNKGFTSCDREWRKIASFMMIMFQQSDFKGLRQIVDDLIQDKGD